MAGDKKLDRRFAFFRFLLSPALKRYFGYSFDALMDVEAPYFLLSNHNTDLDPVFLGMAAACGIRFVASEHIAHKGFISRLLIRLFRPILHVKGKMGIETTREIMTSLRSGISVGLFPEGNRSFYGETLPIPGVTGKLARKTGVKLVTWRLEGGYMTQPRWGKGIRRGKIYGRLAGIYQPEELKAMTDAEVQRHIEEDLYENAFATQAREKIDYRCDSPAEGLESALYLCPACHEIGKLRGRENQLSCACGKTYTLTENMTLRDENGKEKTIAEMAAEQKAGLGETVSRAGEDQPLFYDDVKVSLIGEDHKVADVIVDRLTAYADRFTFHGKTYYPEDINGVAIVGRNALVAHIAEEQKHAEIRGETFYSAVKYENLYRMMKESAGE